MWGDIFWNGAWRCLRLWDYQTLRLKNCAHVRKYPETSIFPAQNFWLPPIKLSHTKLEQHNIRIHSTLHSLLGRHSHIIDMKSNWNEVFWGRTIKGYHLWLGRYDMSVFILWSATNGKHGCVTWIGKLEWNDPFLLFWQISYAENIGMNGAVNEL